MKINSSLANRLRLSSCLALATLAFSVGNTVAVTYGGIGNTLPNGGTLPNGNQTGDIFNWQLSGATGTIFPVWTGDPKNTKITTATFNATFSGLTLSDPFWGPANGTRTWTAITGLSATPTFSSTTFGSYTAGYGTFSTAAPLTGFGLNVVWTPVPEPSSALAGLLLTAGLLRRKRR
jgi:hypothetical protein